jgi:hypothetical protein
VNLVLEYASRTLIGTYLSPLSTGFAITGFGSAEIFPSLVHGATDGYIGSQIKLGKPDTTVISREMDASVIGLAQLDIVHRFMEGIDPDFLQFLRGAIATTIIESNLRVFEKWAPASKKNSKTRQAVQRAAARQYTRLQRAARDYRAEHFWRPTVEMVAILPKDELAHLAESLVELTSLHRRVSREIETVGGPIDVAVISKSDGFVWVKRKHYFSKDLNPQFVSNYMREIPSRSTANGRR